MNVEAEHGLVERMVVPAEVSEGAEAERSAFAVLRDPSLTKSEKQPHVGRGIAWVRPSDLIASSTARIAGRGIDLQADLARRVRRVPGQAYRTTRNQVRGHHARRAERVVSEPSVFDSFDVFEPQDRPRSSSWVRASGIGLG